MWSWMRVRARCGVAGVDGVEDGAVLGAQARGRGVPVRDALGTRLHVGLDRGAQARHHRGDDDVAGCLGEREVQLRVQSEELSGGEVGGIHRRRARRAHRSWSAPGRRRRPRRRRTRARARVRTTSSSGKPCAATCSRSSADMPPRGVAMMIAPEVGPDPVPVRTSPSTSRTRSASRTLERPTPSRAASSRSGGSRSPGVRRPSRRSASMRSSTSRHARAVGAAASSRMVASMRPPRVV